MKSFVRTERKKIIELLGLTSSWNTLNDYITKKVLLFSALWIIKDNLLVINPYLPGTIFFNHLSEI